MECGLRTLPRHGGEHIAHPTRGNLLNPAHMNYVVANDTCIQCHYVVIIFRPDRSRTCGVHIWTSGRFGILDCIGLHVDHCEFSILAGPLHHYYGTSAAFGGHRSVSVHYRGQLRGFAFST